MSTFVLDPRLEADTIKVGSTGLCDLFVMNDNRYPWAILVPRIAGARELHELDQASLDAVMTSVFLVADAIGKWPEVEKVNLGALGNVVSQLHIHVVGRHSGDPAWPGPVWGHSPRVAYAQGAEAGLVSYLDRTAAQHLLQ